MPATYSGELTWVIPVLGTDPAVAAAVDAQLSLVAAVRPSASEARDQIEVRRTSTIT